MQKGEGKVVRGGRKRAKLWREKLQEVGRKRLYWKT